jgi:class 3 adenylate cyclase
VLICADCGYENPEGHRFCGSCGASLTPTVERRKLVTSVFCDLTGSTALGERVDAEAVLELMQSYYGAAREALERHGGTVEKFIGDAVVGMFGVPESHEDDALRACRAALEIQQQIDSLDARIAARIGVNTGEVVTGDAARREMFASGDAVVLGDSVNIAARLEQAASPGEILVGDATYRLVRDAVTAEPVAPIEAKGKSEPLTAYRLLAVGAARRRFGSMVGRREELAALEEELEAVIIGRSCRVVTVIGEPGVGKSRLATELLTGAATRARVVRGACLSYGDGITYWALGQIVRELAGIGEEERARDARERVPLRVAQLLGLADGSVTADQGVDAVAEFLAEAAAERPLLLLVDDIHWAEAALLDLLAALPAVIGGAPVLVLCVARPELRELRPDWLVNVEVGPLGAADVDALLDGLDAPVGVRARIAQVAAGNPLFAEELAAWLADGGSLEELPASLNALLGSRLDRLAVGERDALERAAIEGELFHEASVVELTDPPARSSVPDELDGLNRKDLIRLGAATFAGEAVAYRFKHILVRDAAYNATTKKLRALLHERFADWLEQHAGDRVGEYDEILGYHLEQVYRYRGELGIEDEPVAGRAARHLGDAGRRANERGDPRAAANLLGRAAGLLHEGSRERLDLLQPYEYALMESGRLAEARAINRELYERATALGDERLAAWARLTRSRPGEDPDQERAEAEQLIATFTKLGDTAGLAAAHRKIGFSLRHDCVGEAVEWLERALVHARASDDVSTRRMVIQTLAMNVAGGPMPVPEATVRCHELRSDVEDDRVADAVVVRCLAWLAAMASDADQAREYLRASSRVLDEASMSTPSGVSRNVAADAKLYLGDRTGAEHELEAIVDYFRTVGGPADMRAMNASFKLAGLYCDDERWEDAEACIASYRAIPESRWIAPEATRRAVEARLAAHSGPTDRADTLARRAVELSEKMDSPNGRAAIWLAAAEVHRAAGRLAEADDATFRALELYRQKGNVAAEGRLQEKIGI